jgi:HEAT repeat protein
MAIPLGQTFDVLARSRNDAATAVLMAALESPDQAIFEGAVIALVRRPSKAGHLAVLKRWHVLTPALRETVDQSEGRMGGALHDALLSGDDQLFENACHVARESGEFDLAPTLIMVAEQSTSARSDSATGLVVEMVNRLAHATSATEPGGYSRHPETIRKGVLESLERSIERFIIHTRRELVEAFVVLAGPESPSLRVVLESSGHPCYGPVMDVLNLSTNVDVLALLVAYLTSQDAPAAVRTVVSRRTDSAYMAALLGMPLDGANAMLVKNLGRIKSFACLASADATCKRLSPDALAAAMRLVSLSGVGDEAKLDFAGALLARGAQPARVAACEALEAIVGARSNELVLAALADADGDVQAAATRQLRDRHIPGTMAKLISLVSSPHPQVQAAARESLAEFSFDNLVARYETLDNEGRRQTAQLVAMIDVEAVTRLKQEMESRVHRRRMRAIELAELMGLTARVADALIERLLDEDHMVRAAAASALADCTALDVRDALLEALGDKSFAVQAAARESLRTLGVETAVGSAGGEEAL